MPSIRKASIEDAVLINELARQVFPHTYKGIISQSQINYMMDWMYSTESIINQMDEGHNYFIAYEGGEPIGYLSINKEKDRVFHLQKLYVLPIYQGNRYGEFLFNCAIDYIKYVNPQSCILELNVNRDNSAVDFYKKLGMKIVREGDFDIGDGYYMNDYIMSIKVGRNKNPYVKIYVNQEASRCLLCNDPLCSKGCKKEINTGKIIRSIFFQNFKGAALHLEDKESCLACDTKSCLKTCSRLKIDRPIDFPFILEVIRDNYKTTIDKKYPSLEVDFCGFKCENPFILASSVIGHNYQMCAKALSMGWAGVSIKTLSYTKILETSPRFDVSDKFNGHFCGLKNLEQLSENSVEEDLIWIKKLKQDFPTKLLIVSIMGQNEQEWEDLARLAEASGADIIECNFSCPQMTYKGMGSDTGQDPQLVELYTKACKRGTKLPILAKLTPNLSSPDTFVNAALNGGAEGIVGINTIKSLTSVKFNKLHPGNNGKTAVSGYSGKAIKPIALRFIRDVSILLDPKKHTLSGVGGIETWKDALDFIRVGCSTVQVCTAVMEYGYRIIEDLCEGLQIQMINDSKASLADYIGESLPIIVEPSELDRKTISFPRINQDVCVRCGRCFISCNDGGHQAIELMNNRLPKINLDKCVGCHLCRLVCPSGAIISDIRMDKEF